MRGLNQIYYLTILLLALPSIWLMLRRPGNPTPWAVNGFILCVYFTLISVVFSGQSRFHFCLMPFIAMYAAWTLTRQLPPWTPQKESMPPKRAPRALSPGAR